MRNKIYAKAAAAFTAAAMLLSVTPHAGAEQTIRAEIEWSKYADHVTALGTGMISKPKAPAKTTDTWTGSYIYFGRYGKDKNRQPLKFRVLDPNASVFGGKTLFLDCDTALFCVSPYDDLNQILNTGDDALLKTCFTSAEAAAIKASTIKQHTLTAGSKAGNVPEWIKEWRERYIPLNGEKLFLLDAEDVCNSAYGYSVEKSSTRIKKQFAASEGSIDCWTLRTDSEYSMWSVENDGTIGVGDCDADIYGVSPAFNLDPACILLTSVANPQSAADYGKEYKLTLKAKSLTITPGTLSRTGDTVTVPYTVMDSMPLDGILVNTVSVLIVRSDGTVRYYAPLTKSNSAESSSGTFDVPANFDEATDKVYLLAEDVSSPYLTDYASDLVEITLPAAGDKQEKFYPVTEGLDQVVSADAAGATFRIKCGYEKFSGIVKVDGKELNRGTDYTDKSDDTVITLTENCLKTLAPGKHIMEAFFEDGCAAAEFTVEEAAVPVETTVTAAATTATATSTTITAVPKQMTGDLNEDSGIDVKDAVLLARLVGHDTRLALSEQGIANADVNKNGTPDTDDIVILLQYIARLIFQLPEA